ncbi:hypothetical protein V6N12_003668 [Hibiscus sabdariffa]|uniref:Uncharacterized protein n=1 Tax=Hibiscus sabdariffa TaxID=183260 RepID=A0ABR2AMQ0_9ROSI
MAVENLEDKVPLERGGTVMDDATVPSKEPAMGSTHEEDNDQEGNDDMEQAAEPNHGLHKGMRERRAPKALTDFALF